ncbi:unnamed protein product [Ostreobium quekettii]|uniref:Phosphatidylinositol N-acetylglucosaminyltransferase n=1 Tax=Ostreobium quekettii TaxID=121088 RepID=A0A8S1IPP5_9CHLO|nr:unnamed protein product [Ostreobium quekettii]
MDLRNSLLVRRRCCVQVVVFTHAYGDRSGVRYLTNGLKVYYAPRVPIYCQSTFPNIFGGFQLLRNIIIRERINLVHCHQAFSSLGLHAILQARTMGMKVVFTDHSLFGFADASSILMNKVLKFILADVHHTICVSHTSKENTVLRACLPPSWVSVIPNAVDASQFTPDSSAQEQDVVTIVALTRLVYRKGIDLLAVILPDICRRHPKVKVLICGDGPKRRVLERIVDRENLHSQVTLHPAVPHSEARQILARGQIFLNASLTEAFCMAIVEAASVGLRVVSTRVGGVPEVLPLDMMILAEPEPNSILEAVDQAIDGIHGVDVHGQHLRVKTMYSWARVAERTLDVYDKVNVSTRDDSLFARLRRYHRCGWWAGKLFCCVASLQHLYCQYLGYWCPEDMIDSAPDFCAAAAAAAEGH